jgi:hypothetical protein
VRETYGKNIGVWRSKSILLASRTGGHATSTLSSKNSFNRIEEYYNLWIKWRAPFASSPHISQFLPSPRSFFSQRLQ